MKTYWTQSCGSIVGIVFLNIMGFVLLRWAVQDGIYYAVLFFVGWLALLNISWLRRAFRVMLTYDGVLVIRALPRVIAKIPIHEIARISFPNGPFFPLSWTNWEETGGKILIQHGSTKTRIDRFPNDEDFVMELVNQNPAIQIERTPPISGD